MSQTNVTPPSLPLAPDQYDRQYMDKLNNALRLFFNQTSTPGPLAAASMNFNINTLPTEADLPNLRIGDVYRDTQDGVQVNSQMLRIKTSL
jgi:hypothetical protein